jgi:hypothetical protein
LTFDWVAWVLSQTGSQELTEISRVQPLWGGYGELLRLSLRGGPMASVILKRVDSPDIPQLSLSDRRKRRSYAVEQTWYQQGSQRCHPGCRVARCYGVARLPERSFLLLEDLKNAGFQPVRPPQALHVRSGLSWLAHFHALFLETRPPDLWEQGTYWHLDTRREEWQRMPRGPLKEAARALDERLRKANHQTLLHGDAKPANFCWTPEGAAAAVDFQYVGPGCGIRDVAYFLDCCLGESGCQSQAQGWLDTYFTLLRQTVRRDISQLEREWRSLFCVAWSDFCRFEQGWGQPGPAGPYSQAMLDQALGSVNL